MKINHRETKAIKFTRATNNMDLELKVGNGESINIIFFGFSGI